MKGGYSFAAREQSPGEIWHPGYFDHRIRDADDFHTQLKYIENNPRRKSYVDYPFTHLSYLNQLDDLPPHLTQAS
jgi:hypothetical protein